MAMTKCRECGQAVSSDAKACPNCGAKDPSMSSYITTAIGGCLFLIVVIFVMVKGCDTLRHPGKPNSQTIAPQPTSQQQIATGR